MFFVSFFLRFSVYNSNSLNQMSLTTRPLELPWLQQRLTVRKSLCLDVIGFQCLLTCLVSKLTVLVVNPIITISLEITDHGRLSWRRYLIKAMIDDILSWWSYHKHISECPRCRRKAREMLLTSAQANLLHLYNRQNNNIIQLKEKRNPTVAKKFYKLK